MSYIRIDNEEREKSAMGRFEIMCERYINGTNREREIILSFLDEEEKKTFLTGCGLYHMYTDSKFYDAVKKAVIDQIYDDIRK